MAESRVSNERLAFFKIFKIRNDGEMQKLLFHVVRDDGNAAIKDVAA